MKKITLIILAAYFAAVICSPCFGATWYANALNGQNINYTTGGAGWFQTDTGACTANGTQLTWDAQGNGDIFEANGCAGIVVNVDPRGTGLSGTQKVVLKTTEASGTFSAVTSTSPITIHADITAVAGDGLTVTGTANANPALSIVGNITGGNASGIEGVIDTHTVGTVVVTGDITGGTSSITAYGYNYNSATTNGLSITGNVTGNYAIGLITSNSVS